MCKRSSARRCARRTMPFEMHEWVAARSSDKTDARSDLLQIWGNYDDFPPTLDQTSRGVDCVGRYDAHGGRQREVLVCGRGATVRVEMYGHLEVVALAHGVLRPLICAKAVEPQARRGLELVGRCRARHANDIILILQQGNRGGGPCWRIHHHRTKCIDDRPHDALAESVFSWTSARGLD